jgi:hypothetical protein
MKKRPGRAAAAAATCLFLSPAIAAAEKPEPPAAPAQAPSLSVGSAGVGPPPSFDAPVFQVPAQAPDTPSPDRPATPSHFVVQLDGGAMYRRLLGTDVWMGQLSLAMGNRTSRGLVASAFVSGALGSTNQGLEVRHLAGGGELAFPLSRWWPTGFVSRLTPALRPRVTYDDVARVTTTQRFYGIGLGLDGQLGVDLWQEGQHGIFAVARLGIEGMIGNSSRLPGISLWGMWGGALGVGFRY